MVVWDARGLHQESDATLAMLKGIGGSWRTLALMGRVLPRALRDVAYRFVASRRYGWFGTADACRVPRDQEAACFLP